MPEKQSLLKKKHFFTLTMTKLLTTIFQSDFLPFNFVLLSTDDHEKKMVLDLSLFRGASNVPIAPIKLYIIWLVQFCQTVGSVSQIIPQNTDI